MTSHSTDTTCTRDGHGAGDRDQRYRFGCTPTSLASYPFSTRQFIRLLVLWSRIDAGLTCSDDPRGSGER